jgi:hypothetical protein
MPQRASQDRPFRARNLALVGGLIAVSLAARSQQPAGTPAQAPAQPPAATTPAPADTTAKDTTAKDTTAMADSMAMMMMDSTHMPMHAMHMAAEAPAAAPTEWPVDPATGQTLINGEPVVGKVFIMKKTDGTVKIADVKAALAGEPAAPDAAVVGGTAAPANVSPRRIRGIMVQSTLWMLDHKAKAVRLRHYGPTTSGESLGQQY